MYDRLDNWQPSFTLSLASDTQQARASRHWQQYLAQQPSSMGASYMCGGAGQAVRGRLIGKALGIAFAVAAGLGLLGWLAYRLLARWLGQAQVDRLEPGAMLLVLLAVTLYDEVGDWQYLRQLADSGNAFLLLIFGLMLWAANVLSTFVVSAVTIPSIRAMLDGAGYATETAWAIALGVLQLYTWVAPLVGLIMVALAYKDPKSVSACLTDPAAICKPQAADMFALLVRCTLPAIVALHLWPLLCEAWLLSEPAHAAKMRRPKAVTEVCFALLEDVPQFVVQTLVWYQGLAYVSESTYLVSAVGSVLSLCGFAWQVVRKRQRRLLLRPPPVVFSVIHNMSSEDY